MTPEYVFFLFFAFATVFASVAVVILRNPVASAMALVAAFFFLAGIYVLLWAPTIAVIQVLVYAGAIMVLFLFVIMLLALSHQGPPLTLSLARLLGVASVAALFVALASLFLKLPEEPMTWANDPSRLQAFGSIQALGETLYTKWLFPFEAVSLLLLVAILGAVVVAKAKV